MSVCHMIVWGMNEYKRNTEVKKKKACMLALFFTWP